MTTAPAAWQDRVTWPVLTERLSIRPAQPSDAEATWAYRRLPEVGEWMTSAATDWEDYRARFVDEGRIAKTLLLEQDGRLVGDLMVAVEDAWAQAEVEEQARGVQAEIGWCLDPAYGGRGLATEAVLELLRICFVDLGLRRLVANCFAGNLPSWRLAERVGMRREGHFRRESLHRTRGWQDGMVYGLLAEEFAQR